MIPAPPAAVIFTAPSVFVARSPTLPAWDRDTMMRLSVSSFGLPLARFAECPMPTQAQAENQREIRCKSVEMVLVLKNLGVWG